MVQVSAIGPMFGQFNHFARFADDDYGLKRYTAQMHNLYAIVNRRLEAVPYLGGQDYSIADIATWPWIARYEWHGIDWANYPDLERWYRAIAARPAVQRGYQVPKEVGPIPLP